MIVPVIAVAFASASLAGPTMSLDDVEALLKAGVGDAVILHQLGTPPEFPAIGVPEILRLKKAGASDALLEQLQSAAATREDTAAAPASEPAAESAESAESHEASFRIYKEIGEDGKEVLHITNLDASGRRMGGPVQDDSPAARNGYTSREPAPADTGDYEPDGWDDDGYDRQPPPVVVNVYPPPAPQPEAPSRAGAPIIYGNPYPYGYVGGVLPGTYGCGLRGRGYVRGVPSPPGSYSHYLRYHNGSSQLYNGTLAYRERFASADPRGPHYRTIGPAAAQASITRYQNHYKHR